MVEVHFQMQKEAFDALIIQLRRRKHSLRGQLNLQSLKGQPLDPQMRADLAQTEGLQELLMANAKFIATGSPYQEPPVDYQTHESTGTG